MSLRVIPLLVLSFILYNVIVLLGGNIPAHEILNTQLFSIPMLRGGDNVRWVFSKGDLIVLLTMILLFFELIKATYTASSSLLDHGLSMVVFIACLVEFLLVPQAATSVFFFIMVATLIDVVAGFSIGIRTARRDFNIGSDA
ncbi:MAG TPA: hypothetical protein VFV47_02305 [Hyphomicrobiaceae bacterium]|jgi:hypothetical protein|nr:hypothetical protein [Hyphomicrobiaceae bacterium]